MSNELKKIQSPVLFVGGLAMRSNEFDDLRERLAPVSKFSSMSFDNKNVGSGPRVDLKTRDLPILEQAEYQWECVEKSLGGDSQKISIFGISMGGMIAASMAYMKPERVKHLVLAATSPNLPGLPAVPMELFAKWTKARTPEEVWKAITIAFGKSTFERAPEIPKNYFDYRVSGANGQSALEFVSQVQSIMSFEGEKVYGALADTGVDVTVLAGEEDVLFDADHVAAIKSKVPTAKIITFEKTGHMLHLENFEKLSTCLLEVLGN